VTITKGVSSSSKATAQISELDIFGKEGASSINRLKCFFFPSDSGTIAEGQNPSESIKNSSANKNKNININNINNNTPPSAKDDRIKIEEKQTCDVRCFR
jgi:hypothetical protein